MKYLFLTVFGVLVAAGVGTVLTEPDGSSDVPVLYWSTDPNPARTTQVDLFHRWLVDEGHVNEKGEKVCELRLDTASAGDPTKKVIQAVAGVGADIMDVPVGQFDALGVLRDVTIAARKLGFSPNETYPAIEPDLVRDGRQVAFPCNIGVAGYLVNADAFTRVGLPVPQGGWDLDAFESAGRAFVAAANPPGTVNRSYFCGPVIEWGGDKMLISLIRSQGLSLFNETLTACTLDDPRYAGVLERVRRWMYEDRILPTGAEVASLSAQSGYGGASMDLFVRGRYAMFYTGRFALIGVRKYPRAGDLGGQGRAAGTRPVQPRLASAYTPHAVGGIPNEIVGARAAAVYEGSPHPELAELFLAFLASEAYNQQIVADADALPPNPAYATGEAFNNPPDYPNEAGVHTAMEWATANLSVALDESPFVPWPTVQRSMLAAMDRVTSVPPLATPEQAAARAAAELNDEIQRTLGESVLRAEQYAELLEIQKKIDARRAAGQKVPAAWIKSPFHRWYYGQRGWLEDEDASALPEASVDGDISREGEAPAEPRVLGDTRLGGSLALPSSRGAWSRVLDLIGGAA